MVFKGPFTHKPFYDSLSWTVFQFEQHFRAGIISHINVSTALACFFFYRVVFSSATLLFLMQPVATQILHNNST